MRIWVGWDGRCTFYFNSEPEWVRTMFDILDTPPIMERDYNMYALPVGGKLMLEV